MLCGTHSRKYVFPNHSTLDLFKSKVNRYISCKTSWTSRLVFVTRKITRQQSFILSWISGLLLGELISRDTKVRQIITNITLMHFGPRINLQSHVYAYCYNKDSVNNCSENICRKGRWRPRQVGENMTDVETPCPNRFKICS